MRPDNLIVRITIFTLLALSCLAADGVAVRLAHEAHQAQNHGQLVRAYLLYAQAAARDPQNPTYRADRDALAPLAQLLTKANVETAAGVSAAVKAVELAPDAVTPDTDIDSASRLDVAAADRLDNLPRVEASTALHDFDFRTDEKSLITQVASSYGIEAIFDRELVPKPDLHLAISEADFMTAMTAVTAATQTFVFPISKTRIFVARDTEQKRTELEPTMVLAVPLPDSLDAKDLTEASNAVRGAFGMRSLAYNSATRTILIRDRISRARVARALLEALILPKAQVSFEVQILALDSDTSYHYGLSLPTTFQLIDFGRIGGIKSVLPTVSKLTSYLAFGGGATLFGVGLADATLFAKFTKSFTRIIYQATVVAGNGQEASFHVGDKYPIPQALNTGYAHSNSASLYNPIGEVTLEDLGLILKLTPHVTGSGDVGIDVEAAYKALGTQTIDTVPEISQREFKGNVRVQEGEWAVLAGLDQSTKSVTRSGLIGLSDVPGLNQVLSGNTRDNQESRTMLVIKPTITRLPMSSYISPQYYVGPVGGLRVLL